MSDLERSFGESVLECVDDMSRILPALRRRYDTLVVVSAMAEHVGAALRVLLHRQICDARDARRLISRIENAALLRERGGARAARPQEE
jgi:inhibitor of KinA sporulation pathway (predicted exonuclease)